MTKLWMSVAAVLAIVAFVFALQRDFDKAFIAAAAGAVAWFLSYRVEMKKVVDDADIRRSKEQDDED